MRRAFAAAMIAAMIVTGIVAGAAMPATAETLRVEGVFAAKARDASLLPTIGVGAITGIDGDDLGMAIEQQLAKLDGGDVPHARLIPPTLRPDGLLTGRVATGVSEDRYSESRERCVEKKDGKCIRRVKYRVACLRRSVDFRADLRLERHADGRTVYADSKTRSDTDWWCEDGGIAIDVATRVDGMIDSIAREVRLDLAPHRERYAIRVQEDRKGLDGDAAGRFRQAVRLTKTDAGAACRTFADVDALARDHGPTLFNLALCAEAAGDYRLAADRYMRARVFATKAGGDVSKGLERVASLAAGAEDVRRMAALTASTGMRGAATPPR